MPVLANPSFARLEPEGVLDFEMLLLQAVLASGARSYKEVEWTRLKQQFPSHTLQGLMVRLQKLTRKNKEDFRVQLEAALDRLRDRRGRGKIAGITKATQRRRLEILEHYEIVMEQN
jgi:hypothetical protein